MEKEYECPICLDKISPSEATYTLTNPCNHFYHYECILSWTKLSASTCPQCRTELTSIYVPNESKTIQIEHKEADKLIGMISQPAQASSSSSNRNNSNQPTVLSTEGLINVIVSTPNTTNHVNSLYQRMLEATSNPLFNNEYDNDDGSRSRNNNGSLFIRRNTSMANSTTDANSENNHLSNQQCCLCDRSVLVTQVIVCPNCSSLYHRSCCDGLNCPLCEEWIDDIKSPIVKKLNRSKRATTTRRNTVANDDSSYYVDLVNEMQRRSSHPVRSQNNDHDEDHEQEAWDALNMIQQSSSNNEIIEQNEKSTNTQHEEQERKLKRPKCTAKSKPKPTLLTESALASLDSKNHNKISKQLPTSKHKLSAHHHDNHHHYHERHHHKSAGLSFTQKLIIQRLLLKPRLNKDLSTKLSFEAYTDLNKNLSHKLYEYVEKNQYAISKLNAIIELAEREGFLPFVNRKSVDTFNDACKDNTIVKRFVNGDWHNNDQTFNGQMKDIIETEVQRWINN